ncbi:LNS2-domain-containing protein [Venturia nashicola]|uniref:LNS2-domain-containing protein n=1 Tax=Venturia nashicola TaxID=86259 RepID=A0A4Z1PF49_9PEZI|nr:LNS2-domain-containing protein [Venturia nashicola]TLD38236.1 LNS2-domain-containing protein [Venturia nashicola]
MQYVRNTFGSVRDAYNSLNPATLSGAIDVIVVEQEDGSLACSPFHVRFGKFSLLRPSDKKVEFTVNDAKQNFSMKLGEGGEAFFVFETSENIPRALQTSPLSSPTTSPTPYPTELTTSLDLSDPEPLDIATETQRGRSGSPADGLGILSSHAKSQSDAGDATPRAASGSPEVFAQRPVSADWSGLVDRPNPNGRSITDELLLSTKELGHTWDKAKSEPPEEPPADYGLPRSQSPPPVPIEEAVRRARNLEERLRSSNIPATVSETGDLMLDMQGYKSTEDEALRAELVARRILSEELEGNQDIGALIGADEHGNLWIYSSEEAKEAADRRAGIAVLNPSAMRSTDAVSDPGYHSDDGTQSDGGYEKNKLGTGLYRRDSDSAVGMGSTPGSPNDNSGEPMRNYAKTLRLTSDQLKDLRLKPGANPMGFTVNKATCQAVMYLWRYDVPIVISDIDGTITKSDALGHLLNMVGRDWTHLGVAKLYTDISQNGYNIFYLTSRSVGMADNTRGYLNSVTQDGHRLPKGPVIMSPDRTMAALRREVYLRKPEVFKMACLRDIMNLFQGASPDGRLRTPFYAGFGNRLTDALSYRSVSIPSTRIFTINSNAEVSMHLLAPAQYRTSYVNMREIVDHYFPPIGMLVKEGGEEYTDFNYWRDRPLDIDEFSASESGSEEDEDEETRQRQGLYEGSLRSEDDGGDEDMGASYFSHGDVDENGEPIIEIVEGDGELEESILMDDIAEEEAYLENSAFLPPGFDGLKDERDMRLDERLDALVLADARASTPHFNAADPQEDLSRLSKVLNSPEREEPAKKDKEVERVDSNDLAF